jgi:hypothetical protein
MYIRGMSTAGAIEYTSQAHNDVYLHIHIYVHIHTQYVF